MLAKTLKNHLLFGDGESYVGQSKTVTLPNLERTMEAWRGGGMDGSVMVDMGQEPLTMEATYGGLMRPILRQYGMVSVDGVQLRFVGAYQGDDTGGVDASELVVRGRHQSIEHGDAESGKQTEFKVKSALTYLKWSINGTTEIEIDLLGFIFTVGGVDRLAEQRRALGMDAGDLSGPIGLPSIRIPTLNGILGGSGGLGGLF
jgi:P2 family phage contractile tail tube protein